jgi:hypothetical protein
LLYNHPMSIDIHAPAYQWLARALTGRDAPAPRSDAEWQGILECAGLNGVSALLHYTLVNAAITANRAGDAFDLELDLSSPGPQRAGPAELMETLRPHTIQLAALELGQTHELKTILQTWAQNAIHPILLKGTPLAYSLYAEPWLRERCDTDVLFSSRDDAKKAHALLEDMGYQNPNAVSGDYISHQFMSYRQGAGGFPHTLDMHWRINNAWAFANAVTFSELEASAISVPSLSPEARTLSHPYALLLACMHRAAHVAEGNANRMLWLFDMHLLAAAMGAEEWNEFEKMALEKGLGEICRDALAVTECTLGLAAPGSLLARLANANTNVAYQPQSAGSRWKIQWMNFRSIEGFSGKANWLKEQLFPSAEYMYGKYGKRSPVTLPWLYVRRFAGGLPKIFSRPGPSSH